MTSSAPPSSGCSVPVATTNFSTADKRVYLYFEASTTQSDQISASWYGPDERQMFTNHWDSVSGTYCYTGAAFDFSTMQPASGSYHVDVSGNNSLIFSVQFSISASPTNPATPQTSGLQPQFRAPWRGVKSIVQGNLGSTSHNTCGHRTLDPNNCNWENTYAIDVGLNYDPVLAAADGQVTYVSDDIGPLGGRQMAVTHVGPHGDTFTSVYMHLSKILVYSGAVSQGQQIAVSGASSGGSETGTGPHLHFHLWSGVGSRDSHTIPIETLLLQRSGGDAAYRYYNSQRRDLDDANIRSAQVQSNCDCSGGTSISYRPNGGSPNHLAGTLVKAANSGTVYLLQGKGPYTGATSRLGIASGVSLRNPYSQAYLGDELVFDEVITISDDEMMLYSNGNIITSPFSLAGNGLAVPDGKLITRENGGEISIISSGMRHPFSAFDIFAGLGYQICNVTVDTNYDTYPVGAPVSGGPSQAVTNIPNLTITFSPNPVPRSPDGSWSYSVTVIETNGVPALLTGLSIGGTDYSPNINLWFGTNVLSAHRQVSGNFRSTGSSGSLNWTFNQSLSSNIILQ